MTTINDPTTNPYAELGLTQQDNLNTGRKDTLDQADFLALLTTQLANQDPFDPLDNKEFISQMAEFSSLSGIQELNNGFGALASSLSSNQALQASSLVGRSVMVPTSIGYLDEQGGIEGRVSLPTSTQNLWGEVKDQSGQVIRRFELGNYSAGDLNFRWDGLNDAGERVPEGVYAVNIYGQTGGTTEQFGTLMRAEVNSVNLNGGSGQILLNLTGLGQVNLSDVEEIGT